MILADTSAWSSVTGANGPPLLSGLAHPTPAWARISDIMPLQLDQASLRP